MCSHVFCTERKLRSERLIFPPLCRAALNRFMAVSRKLYVYLTDTSHASRSVTCDSDLYIGSTVASNSLSATSWQTLNFTHTVYVKKMSRFLVRVSEVKKKKCKSKCRKCSDVCHCSLIKRMWLRKCWAAEKCLQLNVVVYLCSKCFKWWCVTSSFTNLTKAWFTLAPHKITSHLLCYQKLIKRFFLFRIICN